MLKYHKFISLLLLCVVTFLFDSNAQSLDDKIRQACKQGDYVKIEKAIKKNKIDLNGRAGNELYLIAIEKGNDKMVSILIDAGADVNTEDHVGRTPMMAAVVYEQPKIMELLLTNGAKKGSTITKRDYDCLAHDRLEVGLTYREVEKLIGSLGMSMVDVMEQHQFDVKLSYLEKYRFVNGKLSFWKHPCKTSKQQLGK